VLIEESLSGRKNQLAPPGDDADSIIFLWRICHQSYSYRMKLDEAARTAEMSGKDTETVEVSVVMPCLNEGDTLAVCIEKAWRG
jgi:hypothetical protein